MRVDGVVYRINLIDSCLLAESRLRIPSFLQGSSVGSLAHPNIKQELPHVLPLELASSIELYVAAKLVQQEPVYTTFHSLFISTAVMAGGGVIHGTADTSRIEAPVTMKAYLMCAFAAFGGIFFGYDTGWMGGIMGMKLVAPLKRLP